MRERLLRGLDEPAVLDELSGLRVNYDPARAPEHGTEAVEGHWHVDSGTAVIGQVIWQSAVFLGLLLMGALNAFKF